MPAPSATWTVKTVQATYRSRLTLLLEPGSYEVEATGRIVNTLTDGSKQIFLPGRIASGTLNTTPGLPSLSLEVPVVDDPDNSPNGGEIILTIAFTNGTRETLHFSPLESWDSVVDLATIITPELTPTAPPLTFVGVPGGLATLDADGDVVDADGVKVIGGGGGGGGPADWTTLLNKPAVVAAGADQAEARTSIGLGNVENTSDASKPISTATTAALALKAPLASPAFTGTPTGITKAHVGLGNVDNTSDSAKPLSTAATTALAAKADLSGGLIPTSQLPALAVVEYLGASANQTAMLAKTGQKGDWTTRTDTGAVWIITGTDPTQLSSWTALTYPAAPVTSVAGQTGVVVLAKGDVGLGNVDNTSDANKPVSTAQATALGLKQDVSTLNEAIDDRVDALVSVGTGLAKTYNDAGNVYSLSVDADVPFVLSWNGTNWVNKAGTTVSARMGTRPVILQGGLEANRPAWANQLGDEHNAVG